MSEFKTFTVDNVNYKVRKPTMSELVEANNVYAKELAINLQDPQVFLKDQLDDVLRQRGLWNDEKEQKYNNLGKEIIDLSKKLNDGGFKLKEGFNIALKISDNRREMIKLLAEHSRFSSITCEGKAEQAKFNFLISCCLVYEDSGERVYKTVSEYVARADDKLAEMGASLFFELTSGTEDIDLSLVENKFLKRFKFVDDQYRLIDKQGRLIDREGRHIDEDGRYIKWQEDGSHVYVDIDGNEIKQESVETAVFLDDDGNPIDIE